MKLSPLKILSILLIAGIYSNALAQLSAGLVASKSEAAAFFGTGNVKVVFQNGKIGSGSDFLYYIDYSAATPSIKKLGGSLAGILPSISPDGNYVVYSTGTKTDGSIGFSKVWVSEITETATPLLVSDLGFEPRFVQNAAKMTVIYVTEGGSDLWDGLGTTVKREIDGSTVGAEQVIYNGGGFVAGMSYDEKYLATGFTEGRMLDLGNSNTLSTRIHSLNLKSTTGGADKIFNLQVCNTSISSSRISAYAGSMMYIDFGFTNVNYYHPIINNGKNWALHQLVYISDFQNRLLKWIDVPGITLGNGPGDVLVSHWDDPEWSNHPYYGIGNLQNDRSYVESVNPNDVTDTNWVNSSNHEYIFAFNIKAGTSIELVKTNDTTITSTVNIQWPWVWVEVSGGFTEEAGWLDPLTVSLENSGGSIKMADRNKFFVSENILYAPDNISKVAIYNGAGNNLDNILSDKKAHNLGLPVFEHYKSGIYFLKISTEMGDFLLTHLVIK